MSLIAELDALVGAHSAAALEISHGISDHPEIGMEEHAAVALLTDALKALPGVRIECELADLPTAFRASAGDGELVITLCAEYDALPGIGHGCGHNLIAATAFGGFSALVPLADRLGITVQLIGTPGEENAGGKVLLLERGAFASTHAALMLHPGPEDYGSMSPLASTDIVVTFKGTGAHASYAPHLGRNALDALTVMMTAIGLARQQLEPGQQIHGVPTSNFGAANVIPALAESSWTVRAADLDSLQCAVETVTRCARAGALAANCEATIEVNPVAYSQLEPDADLLAAYQRNAEALDCKGPLFEPSGGSTDMGNVSLEHAAIHPMLRLGREAPAIHTREFAAAARGSAGDAFVTRGARLLARTAASAALDPAVRDRLFRRERRVETRR